jgi:4-aminobutyrate--pyruvate transaminase
MTVMPNSTAARDIAYHLHPYTNAVKQEAEGSLVLTRGKGIYVYDEEGKEYIEGLAGLWCTSLGFGEERLVEAAVRQMRKLPYYPSFGQKVPDITVELAERLVKLAPVPMSRAFFCNSGSEANDTAIKMVWYYNNALGRPKKKKIIGRMRGYHGVTVAAASMMGIPINLRDFDLPISDRFIHTDCPHYYRNSLPGESEDDFASRCAANLEKLIQEHGADTIAAFIAEPIQGAGGVIVPPKGYQKATREICRKYDVLYISDEVVTGFGRLGEIFASEPVFDIVPDIITCAKGLTSGYIPLGAFLLSDRLYDRVTGEGAKGKFFSNGFTYSAHPVACAAGLKNLEIMEREKLCERVRELGPYFQERFQTLTDLPLVGNVRGSHLMVCVEFVSDRKAKAVPPAEWEIGFRIMRNTMPKGLLVRPMAHLVVLSPPLIVTRAQIDEAVEALRAGIKDTMDELAREGLWRG